MLNHRSCFRRLGGGHLKTAKLLALVLLFAVLLLAVSPVQAHELEWDTVAGPFVRVEGSTWMNSNTPVSIGLRVKHLSFSMGHLWSDKLTSTGTRYTAEYVLPVTEKLRCCIRIGTDKYEYLPQAGVDYFLGVENKYGDHLALRFGVENGWLYGRPRLSLIMRAGRIR